MEVKKKTHGLFWKLLRKTDGYNNAYKDVIKEEIVHRYSGGKTTSLKEMYEKYPGAYSKMINAMKGPYKKERYLDEQDKARKRVIAAVCSRLDNIGYQFKSDEEKVAYAKRCACRSASCWDFNKIPLSQLTEISFLFNKKAAVDVTCLPLDVKPALN